MSGTTLDRRMRRTNNDEATKAIVYEGASVNQLAEMFGMTKPDIAKKIRGVPSNGMRSGYPVYRIKDVAPYLVKPAIDMDAYVRRMGSEELPPQLQKAYWDAKTRQLDFEKAQGAVWKIERIQETWAEWHKTVRMSLLLAVDEALRDGAMDEGLFEWFKEYIDKLLLTLSEAITKAMQELNVQPSGIVDYHGRHDDDDEDPASPSEAVTEDDDGV